jgi:hypothetical protein
MSMLIVGNKYGCYQCITHIPPKRRNSEDTHVRFN